MASSQDYYQLLGVTKTASDAELKAAYRKAALEWHPDRNKSPEATAKFKEINHAYEVLSDSQKKQAYDQFGHAAFEQGNMGSAGGGPFGGGAGGFQQGPFRYTYRTGGQPGQPFGSARGENPFEGMDFGGFSDPFEIFEQFFGGGFTANQQRRARRATYSLGISFLEAAKGAEKTVEIEGKQMKIKIPSGVDDGTRIRFTHFDVLISVWPDDTFKRQGLDIHVDVKVDFVSAIMGTTVQVPTTNGNVELKIPAGTQPDTLIRLREHGIKEERTNRTGDEYIKVKVQIPTRLSGEQKQLLEQYQETSSGKKKSGWF